MKLKKFGKKKGTGKHSVTFTPLRRDIPEGTELLGKVELFQIKDINYEMEVPVRELTNKLDELRSAIREIDTLYLDGTELNVNFYKKRRVLLNVQVTELEGRLEQVKEILMKEVAEDEVRISKSTEAVFVYYDGSVFFQYMPKLQLDDVVLAELDDTVAKILDENETYKCGVRIQVESPIDLQMYVYRRGKFGICVLTSNLTGSVLLHKILKFMDNIEYLVREGKYSDEVVEQMISSVLLTPSNG